MNTASSFTLWTLMVLQLITPLRPKKHFPHRPTFKLEETSVKLLTGRQTGSGKKSGPCRFSVCKMLLEVMSS